LFVDLLVNIMSKSMGVFRKGPQGNEKRHYFHPKTEQEVLYQVLTEIKEYCYFPQISQFFTEDENLSMWRNLN